jgi:Peptide N-acetyl-beta-D-glucosaminyl asparaginase amidase A
VKLVNLSIGKCLFIAVALLIATTATQAQSTNRKIGTQYTVTADPLVPRPHTKSCVVALFTNYQFALFSETTQNFQFTPPANCSGPYDKVVLDVNFSENAGVQFDRTASMYLGNANIYFGTTPEPLKSATNTWHIERDVTDYSSLFANQQQGTIVLQNCTTDCPPPFNTRLNGIFTVSAKLEFYPAPGHSPAPRTPDAVLPLVQSNGSGGVNLPVLLFSPTDQLTTSFNLPRNVEGAYLDVIAQSQQVDEQWFACFPNDLANINDLFGCGNTDFREVEVTIDGQPAGIAPVSPWVFTGFLPDQWVPTPGVQTLDFVPYRVNLTPFAGLLSNGQPHTIALSVFNDDFYFSTAASLLLYLDPSSPQISGVVTQNTLSSPSPSVTEDLQGTSTVTGTIGVSEKRKYTIAGYIDTSNGRITTSVSQQQNFSSSQAIDFDTVNFSVLDQNTSMHTSVNSLTTVSSKEGNLVTAETFSFPITVNVVLPVNNSLFGLTVATTQKYHTSKLVLRNGQIEDFSSVSNSVSGSDVSPASSSQHYSSFNLHSPPYDCEIASANDVLTKVSVGCSH